MIGANLLLLQRNTWEDFNEVQKMRPVSLKMLSRIYLYKSYIFNTFVWRLFGIK